MAYTYPAMVAFNAGTNAVVRNTVFQVYATTDTGFTTPLAVTDTFGNALANLNSGALGVFPAFQQAQYTTVVVSDTPAHTYAWTVPCSQPNPVTPWAANTYYPNGTPLVNPSGDLVTANVNHTTTGTYDSTKYSYSGTFAPASSSTNYATNASLQPAQQRGLTLKKVGIVLPVGTASFENWVVESPNVVFDPITQQWLMAYVGYSTVPVPSGVAAVTSATGGNLGASQQRFYKVSAITSVGDEGAWSAEVNVTTGAGSTNSNTITWSAVTGCTYRVYVGTTAGGENTYFNVSGTSFTDTGAAGTAGTSTISGAAYNASVGLATSLDGINWTRTGTPVIQGTGNAGDPDQFGTSGPSLWIENGVYNLFYISLSASGYEGGTKRMAMATATNINGPWTRKGAIISPSGSGWRATAVYHRSIVKRPNGTYYMFLNAMGGDGLERIGLATATNILGPWTVDDVNSPVLNVGAGGSWESTNVGDPSMYRVGDTWYMAYYGYNGTSAQDGLAFTSDASFPLGWAKHAQNPLLKIGATGSIDDIYAHKPNIVPMPGGLLHYYTAVGTGQPSIALKSIALAIDAPGTSIAAKVNPQPIADSFTRANSTTGLGTAVTGQPWRNDIGVCQIASNQAQGYTLTNNETVASLDSGFTDGKTTIRLPIVPPTFTAVGLVCRMLDAQNFIYADISPTGIGITQRKNGQDSALLAAVSQTMAAGDTVTAYCYANTITVWHNSTWIGTVQANFAQTGTRRGVRFYGNSSGGGILDDFAVTQF